MRTLWLLVALLALLAACAQPTPTPSPTPDPTPTPTPFGPPPDLSVAVAELPRLHGPPYVYSTRPPTSGRHSPVLSPYGFLDAPLIRESVVHNMEHGALVIWYQPDDPALAEQVRALVEEVGPECIVAGSYADMDTLLTATVWARYLPLETFDAAQLKLFIETYRGTAGAEAGLCFADWEHREQPTPTPPGVIL